MPSAPSRFSWARGSHRSESRRGWPILTPFPITDVFSTTLKPGVSVGTMIMLARWWRAAAKVGDGHDDGEGRAVGGRGKPFVAVDHIIVAVSYGRGAQPGGFEPAFSGSVMEKQRMSPARSGLRKRSFAPACRAR